MCSSDLPRFAIRRLSQSEFGDISYEVMKHVFDIHNQIGGLFDESVYKEELAQRLPQSQLEGQIDVSFDSFCAKYFVDIVVADGAIFEFKAVERLQGIHRAQLINYLLMCDLAHGKLINLEGDFIEHEFVNTNWRFSDTQRFRIQNDRFDLTLPGTRQLQDYVLSFLADLGTGLQKSLYEQAIFEFLGGTDQIKVKLPVRLNGHLVGHHEMALIQPDIGIIITSLDQSLKSYETNTRRLLAHLDLRAINWINITMNAVTFVTLHR